MDFTEKKIWFDVEEPKTAVMFKSLFKMFQNMGAELFITARDYDSTYKILDEKYYPPMLADSAKMSYMDFSVVFFRAWLYFMLEPFPWRSSTKLQLLAYPQTILWYFLIPFIIL